MPEIQRRINTLNIVFKNGKSCYNQIGAVFQCILRGGSEVHDIEGCLIPLFWISLTIFSGFYVYRDAQARGKSQNEALAWTLGTVFICFPLILIVYLVKKFSSPVLRIYGSTGSSANFSQAVNSPPTAPASGPSGGLLTTLMNPATLPTQQTAASVSPPAGKSRTTSPGTALLFSVVKSSNIDALKELLQQGTELNQVDKDGTTALHWAVNSGLKEIAELLIGGGAELSAEDNDGRTPLHWAAFADFRDIAGLLLMKGAEVNARDYDGRTPVHDATEQGFKEMVELLISKGADVNMKDSEGKSPLQIATSSQYTEVADLLRLHGAWS